MRLRRLALPMGAVLALSLALPAPAAADLVTLTSGRVLSVDSCQIDGDIATLVFRDGSLMRVPKSYVAVVAPDEVPHPKPTDDTVAAPPAVAAPLTWTVEMLHTLVDQVAAKVGVDLKLARAVVQTESNFDPRAVSSKGAMGLMQLMPDVAREYGLDNPFDPTRNLEAGLRHLQDLVSRLGVTLGLAAYNAGEGAVSRYGGRIPPFPETQDYVRQVLALSRQP